MILNISPTGPGQNQLEGGRHFGGVHVSNASVRNKVEVIGWITGNLTGGIDAARFGMTVNGIVQAPLRGRVNSSGGARLVAGSTTSTGTLFVDQGNIARVEVSGTIAGNITASAGRIDDIICGSLQANVTAHTVSNLGIHQINVTNDIGSPSNPVTITAVGDVRFVTAANAWADIAVTGTQRSIHRIATSGNFTGSISAFSVDYADTTFQSGVQVGGNLDADVTFSGYCAARLNKIEGNFPAGRTLWIGQAWGSPVGQTREMEFGSLGGQIIVNGNAGASTWSGPITVNGHRLAGNEAQPNQAPYYERLSSTFGGGAIGRVPFNIHPLECFPPPFSSLVFYPTMTVGLVFYGPVTWTGTQSPVIIDWWPIGGSQWIELPEEDFHVGHGTVDREILITAMTPYDFEPGSHYRLRPRPGVLKSDTGATGLPDVFGFEYILYGD